MMMFELFSEAARKVLLHATQEASTLGHQAITPEHLVLGLMKDIDSIAATTLAEHGVERQPLADAITDTGTAEADILHTIGIDLQSVRRQAETSGRAHWTSPGRDAADFSGHGPRAVPCPTQTPQQRPCSNLCRRHKPSTPAP